MMTALVAMICLIEAAARRRPGANNRTRRRRQERSDDDEHRNDDCGIATAEPCLAIDAAAARVSARSWGWRRRAARRAGTTFPALNWSIVVIHFASRPRYPVADVSPLDERHQQEQQTDHELATATAVEVPERIVGVAGDEQDHDADGYQTEHPADRECGASGSSPLGPEHEDDGDDRDRARGDADCRRRGCLRSPGPSGSEGSTLVGAVLIERPQRTNDDEGPL